MVFISINGGGKRTLKMGKKNLPKKIRRENKYKASLLIYH